MTASSLDDCNNDREEQHQQHQQHQEQQEQQDCHPQLADAIAESRITRKGRRVAREKLASPQRLLNSTLVTAAAAAAAVTDDPVQPGAFAELSRPTYFNAARYSLELHAARMRLERVRNSRSYQMAQEEPIISDEGEDTSPQLQEQEPVNLEPSETTVPVDDKPKTRSGRKGVFVALAALLLSVGIILIVVFVLTTRRKVVEEDATLVDDGDIESPVAGLLSPSKAPTLLPTNTPTRSRWNALEVYFGEKSFDRLGESVALSSDGRVWAFSYPGTSQVLIRDRITEEGFLYVRATQPKIVKLSEDGDVLVVAHPTTLAVFRYVGQAWKEGVGLEQARLFPEDNTSSNVFVQPNWSITSLSIMSDGERVSVALGSVHKANQIGKFAVYRQKHVSSSWVQVGTSIRFQNGIVNLELVLCKNERLLAVGIHRDTRVADASHRDEVHVYNENPIGLFVPTGDTYAIRRKLYSIDMVQVNNDTAVLAYLDFDSIHSFELDLESGTMLKVRGPAAGYEDDHFYANDAAVLVSRDGLTVVYAWLDMDARAAVSAKIYKYSVKTDGYEEAVPLSVYSRALPSSGHIGQLSIALAGEGTLLSIGASAMAPAAVDSENGYAFLLEISI